MRVPMLLLGVAALAACGRAKEPVTLGKAEPALSDQVTPAMLASFKPLPELMASADNPVTPAKADLGRRLYYETLLSGAHNMSCNSCHALNGYGADGRPRSMGDHGELGGRNAPSVYNAAGHVAQFWDGRAPTVEEQAKGPILNPVEMGMSDRGAVLAHLKQDPSYVRMFRAAFPGDKDPVTYDNVGLAIGAFERGLVTPSRWDEFLAGKQDALTAEERIGLNAFVSVGCVGCHNGAYVGGGSFNKLGVVEAWPDQSDLGREKVTSNKADAMVFKVASLRNVEMTSPYFHDGMVADLAGAVHSMGRYQLGRELTPEQIRAIVTYLKTLTGTLPIDYIAYPSKPN